MHEKILSLTSTEVIVLVFDQSRYNFEQKAIALNCPINRMATKEEYYRKLQRDITDWDLFDHPDWLMQHFIENGGAVEFEKRRNEFFKRMKIGLQPEPEYSI